MRGYIKVGRCKPPKDRTYDNIGFILTSAFGDRIEFQTTPDEALEIAAKAVLSVAEFFIYDKAYYERYIKPRVAKAKAKAPRPDDKKVPKGIRKAKAP